MLISEKYRKLNASLNARYRTTEKQRLRDLSAEIQRLIKKHQLTSILDYGCCKLATLHKILGPIVRNYDPAIPAFAKLPEPADLVVCSHVLEHVETECLDAVLDHIQSLSLKLVILIVPRGGAVFRLDDGTNPHITQEGWEWWSKRILKRFECIKVKEGDNSFYFLGKPLCQATSST